MHAFDVLGDPVRRRILELLAVGEHASGEVVEVISKEFGITQSAVSQQLKILRANGFATVQLDAMTIKEEKAAIITEPDKSAYRAKDVAPTAVNASEVLENTPQVQVDQDR